MVECVLACGNKSTALELVYNDLFQGEFCKRWCVSQTLLAGWGMDVGIGLLGFL